ncbi:hypothetical protein RRG08_005120, partial [Elysia crispata]
GEVTPASLHWCGYNTGSQQPPVISPGSIGVELGFRVAPDVQPPSQVTERIISLLLNASSGPTHIFSTYVPTLSSSPEVSMSSTRRGGKNPRDS